MIAPTVTGPMSTFGGPQDSGVSPSEGLALCEPHEMDLFPENLFLPEQPDGTSGLARRLNPQAYYVAARWNYAATPRDFLQGAVVIVTNPANGRSAAARPIDWGPNETTGRVCDLSPGLAHYLDLETDDTCTMRLPPAPVVPATRYDRVVISSAHALYVRGAVGLIDEVDESRNVVTRVAKELERRGVDVKTFHDNASTTQSENLETIVAYHNAQSRDLDVSIHFNAYEPTVNGRGTETFYVTQNTLANEMSAAIAACGLINRGGKKNNNLYFLNGTKMPAILIEVAFVDSGADVRAYKGQFDAICTAIADVLAGQGGAA
jgi:N-acetylmuramoyl-L-alanine amidase